MMRLRSTAVIVFMVTLFILWNLTIYLWLGRNQHPNLEISPDLSERLNRLQSRLKDQMQTNEELLIEIDQQKENILRKKKLEEDEAELNRHLMEKEDAISRSGQRVVKVRRGDLDQDVAAAAPPVIPYDDLPQNQEPKAVIAVLVIACNRPSAIKRSLDTLLKNRPSEEQFPIVVSQDCGHTETATVIESYGDRITYIKQPDLSRIANIPQSLRKFEGYYKISRHYKWALSQVFNTLGYDSVLVVEDDLDVAEDFFQYFASTHHLLAEDETLWCVSAWNDNGKSEKISDPEKLYRTDFFPGLGWMTTKKVWLELEPKWPAGFWDDWMRQPDQRRERACIRPEISRTDTFGKVGTSKGQYFDQHLKFIVLNKEFVDFSKKDLSYLKKENYDKLFLSEVYSSPEITLSKLIEGQTGSKDRVRLTYTSTQTFKSYAKSLKIMNDFKSGVPRTAYLGVVTFLHRDTRVYIAPPQDWSGYNLDWT